MFNPPTPTGVFSPDAVSVFGHSLLSSFIQDSGTKCCLYFQIIQFVELSIMIVSASTSKIPDYVNAEEVDKDFQSLL